MPCKQGNEYCPLLIWKGIMPYFYLSENLKDHCPKCNKGFKVNEDFTSPDCTIAIIQIADDSKPESETWMNKCT